jgi:hypothetical protein
MRILLLATMLTLAACNSQQPPKSADEINQLIAIADKAISVAQKIGMGAPEADAQEATREMYAVLDTARNQTEEILHQVTVGKYLGRGSIDPIDVSACIASHIVETHSLEEMSPSLVQLWSMDVGQCAINADVYFQALSPSDGAAIALALGIIYPVALVAKARAGFDQGNWLKQYRSSNEAIIAKLGPRCGESKAANSSEAKHVSFGCAAYEVAMAVQPKLRALAEQVPASP